MFRFLITQSKKIIENSGSTKLLTLRRPNVTSEQVSSELSLNVVNPVGIYSYRIKEVKL